MTDRYTASQGALRCYETAKRWLDHPGKKDGFLFLSDIPGEGTTGFTVWGKGAQQRPSVTGLPTETKKMKDLCWATA